MAGSRIVSHDSPLTLMTSGSCHVSRLLELSPLYWILNNISDASDGWPRCEAAPSYYLLCILGIRLLGHKLSPCGNPPPEPSAS